YRIALGPQLVPSYPGADGHSLRPFGDISIARGDRPFAFEAPDESFGLPLLRSRGFEAGPALNFEGRRRREEVGADLDEVGITVEAGGFAQYWLTPGLRFRAEARKGIGGHKGWIGNVGADIVARDGDRWLVSAGPRVTFTDGRYQRAFFGVNAREAAATGLPTFTPEGGVSAAGATVGAIYQFSPRWGVQGYAKYDRLISDAARSPVVRAFGSRDQFSGGLALSYTFGRGVR
ncbi:MAG TPA: MipA/OmpV family protein, partial [Sphingomonas sp.]|nr:MipA/OmpV family protein [Sphingomonas sp.]